MFLCKRITAILGFCALASSPGCGQVPDAVQEVDYAQTVCQGQSVVEGIDVSAYQPNTDWAQVKAAGIGFAVIKATEGTGYTNSYFARDWGQTKAQGMVRGAYHFFHSNIDPVAQADFFVDTVGPIGDGDLPLVLDLEVTDGQSASTVASTAAAFLARVEQRSGRTPMIYTSPGFWSGLGNPAGFEHYYLWVANWGVSCPNVPSGWSTWPMWQYADNGTVAGVSGASDLDRFNGSWSDLLAFTSTRPALAQASGNDSVTLVNWPDGHAELFGVGAAGDALHSYTGANDDNWSGPDKLDGNAECGMAASFWGAPWLYPELFGPTAGGGTGHLWFTAGTGWNTWQDYGGAGLGLSHFSTVVWKNGTTEVFALGADGAIWHDFWDLGKGDWSGWSTMAGSFVTGASAILWNDDHVELFAVDAQGAAWHNWSGSFPSGWHGWESLGGQLASKPVAMRWDDGHVELFARGVDGHLQHSWFDLGSGAWQPWSVVDSSTVIVGEPQVIENPKGAPGATEGAEVFARDASGRVVHLWWSGSAFTPFSPLGNLVAASDPFGWIRADGHGEVFAVDGQGQLVRTLRDGGGAWSDWSPIGSGFQACAQAAAGPTDDGGMASGGDGGVRGDGGTGTVKGGCSCSTGRPAGGRGWIAIALFGIVAVWRRRRR